MSPSFNHHGNAEPILTLIWLVLFLFVLGFKKKQKKNCISNSAKTKLCVSQPLNPKPVNSRMSDVRDKLEKVSTCLSAKRSFWVCQPTQHSASVVTCFIWIPLSTDVSCDSLWTCKLPKLHCKISLCQISYNSIPSEHKNLCLWFFFLNHKQYIFFCSFLSLFQCLRKTTPTVLLEGGKSSSSRTQRTLTEGKIK